MPHKKSPPKPPPKPQRRTSMPSHKKRVVKASPPEETMTQDEEIVTQSTSTEAGPYAHIDPDAQAEVQKALNLRVAHDTRVPYKPAKVPPGLKPNEILSLALAGALETQQQTDQPQETDEFEESDEHEHQE